MSRRSFFVFAVGAAALVGMLPASADAAATGSWNYQARSGGLPVGAAVGGWSSDTTGRGGDLQVDTLALPEVASLSWSATWTSDGRSVAAGDPDDKVAVAEAAAITIANAVARSSTSTLKLEHRFVQDGVPGPWETDFEQTGNSTRTATGHSSGGGGASLLFVVSRDSEKSSEYQVQFRASGVKSGDDQSRLGIITRLIPGN